MAFIRHQAICSTADWSAVGMATFLCRPQCVNPVKSGKSSHDGCMWYGRLLTLKTKDRHFDNLVVIGSIVRCHYDNLLCHQWRQCCEIDDSFVFGACVPDGLYHRDGRHMSCCQTPREHGTCPRAIRHRALIYHITNLTVMYLMS